MKVQGPPRLFPMSLLPHPIPPLPPHPYEDLHGGVEDTEPQDEWGGLTTSHGKDVTTPIGVM